MNNKKIKVLLIIEQCNPEWFSVPLVGYNYYNQISKLVNTTLVTHERNKEAFEKQRKSENTKIIYINESEFIKKYYKVISLISSKPLGGVVWPLLHTLSYPMYAEFNQKVYQLFKDSIIKSDYDIVHAITPMIPRYPVKVVQACQNTPFIIGPVNGGVPFPPAFQETAKKENANLNFLRNVGRFLIPGYRETYQKATRVLAGSTYTLNMLKNLFNLPDNQISLFYENGIPENFVTQPKQKKQNGEKINLLFVGRLVPYKCADIVIQAISYLDTSLQNQIQLTIVGDGEEKNNLEKQVKDLNLSHLVKFTGLIPQAETLTYYNQADIFCFPSIREFGGAVVLEAMASGLPCIVVNNGGIGEYVTEETGFKIEPTSKNYLIQEVTDKIKLLVTDENLRLNMSANAIERAKEFVWKNKAQKILTIYEHLK
ncbi:glycosyltransferase family 4 protein [Geminocystis sp. GBBB08]|uniref:glycosyltransferase family 4 protein n=1 Tax=Geminocystis sp. GBBB08 TaxID=2604140 RepID=UPI0027E3B2A1|nr:glycosyltransferase family 4 protein [Geminocystis sp. GBBB08]MBL1211621.1 glycosyltransferase family 4 protein [Geminocystis sp. GBBB08]